MRSNVAVASAEKKRCKLVGSTRGALETDLASEEDNMVEILWKQDGQRATKPPLSLSDDTHNQWKCRPILLADNIECRAERSSVCRATPKKSHSSQQKEATHYCTQYYIFGCSYSLSWSKWSLPLHMTYCLWSPPYNSLAEESWQANISVAATRPKQAWLVHS